jgi:hypothetical protein
MAGSSAVTRWLGLLALLGQLLLLAAPVRAMPGPIDPLAALGPAICSVDGGAPEAPHGTPHDCPVCFFCVTTGVALTAVLPSPPVLPTPTRSARVAAGWAPPAIWRDRTPEHRAARDPPSLLPV